MKKKKVRNRCKIWLETKEILKCQESLTVRQELKEVLVEGKDGWLEYELILETYLDYDFQLIPDREVIYHIHVFPRTGKGPKKKKK